MYPSIDRSTPNHYSIKILDIVSLIIVGLKTVISELPPASRALAASVCKKITGRLTSAIAKVHIYQFKLRVQNICCAPCIDQFHVIHKHVFVFNNYYARTRSTLLITVNTSAHVCMLLFLVNCRISLLF